MADTPIRLVPTGTRVPKIGDRVLYMHRESGMLAHEDDIANYVDKDQPFTAVVVFVHRDTWPWSVNLSVTDHLGISWFRERVNETSEADPTPGAWYYQEGPPS